MNATAFKIMRRFKYSIIAALGVLVLPLSIYADNNPMIFKKTGIAQRDDLLHIPFSEFPTTRLSISGDPGVPMAMPNADAPLILVSINDQLGAHSFRNDLEKEKIYQFAMAEQLSSSSDHGRNRERLVSLSVSDSTSWFNLSTDQILLVFGLMGFLSSRKRKQTKNNDPNAA